MAKQLGYVQRTGETAPSEQPSLSDRVFYRLTQDGLDEEDNWRNLGAVLYPRAA